MMASVFAPSADLLQYIDPNPIYFLELNRRYGDLQTIETDLRAIASQFCRLQEIGHQFAGLVAEARTALDSLDFFCSNPNYESVSSLFSTCGSAFSLCADELSRLVIDPIERFIRREFGHLDTAHKKYDRDHTLLLSAQEKYVGASGHLSDFLVDAHSHSTLSFYKFTTEMQITETKLKGLLPSICLSFVKAFKLPLETILAREHENEAVLKRVASSSAEVASEVSRLQSDSRAFLEQLAAALPGFWAHIADPIASDTSTSTQGYLWKKAGWHWKRRLCMISNGVLCYGKTPESAMRTAKKNIPLLYCSVKPEPMSSRPNCFSIRGSAKGKLWVFQALTPRALNTWLAVIQNNIMQRLIDPDNSGPRSDEEGHICAECLAKGATWASLNWCVRLCLNCASVHRGLPGKVSMVRSLELDEIPECITRLFDALDADNVVSAVLEANLGDARQSDDFINRKYIAREFVAETTDSILPAIKAQSLPDVYRILKGSRGDLFPKGTFGPLHAAAIVGNPDIFTLICLNSPSIDALDDAGWSPLSYATAFENAEVIRILLEFDADPKASPSAHPYMIARALRNPALEQKFEAAASPGLATVEVSELPHNDFRVPASPPTFRTSRPALRRGSVSQDIPTGEREKIWRSVRRLSQRKLNPVRTAEVSISRKRNGSDSP
jgi:hypothetical protein